MKQPMFIKNSEIDEKRISFIETILSRLTRRSRKVATAMIFPVPISIHIQGDNISGDILKVLLFEGRIIRGIIRISPPPKSPIVIDITIINKGSGNTKTLFLDNSNGIVDIDIDTVDGSILTIGIDSQDEEYKMTELLMSLLWVPSRTDAVIKRFLIEEIEESVNDLLKE